MLESSPFRASDSIRSAVSFPFTPRYAFVNTVNAPSLFNWREKKNHFYLKFRANRIQYATVSHSIRMVPIHSAQSTVWYSFLGPTPRAQDSVSSVVSAF